MAKIELAPSSFARVLNCGPTILAVAQYGGPPNIVTLSWCSPVSLEPPLVMIAVSPRRYSHALIADSGELTLNVPPWSRLAEVHFCGTVSGRDVDKFAECDFEPLPSLTVAPPGIGEALATLECGVEAAHTAGDHTMFICRVRRLVADEEAVRERFGPGFGEPTTIHHLGGNYYAPLGGPAVEPEGTR